MRQPLPLHLSSSAAVPPRAIATAKITGAALAAAFAAQKKGDQEDGEQPEPPLLLTLEEKEDRVVSAIRAIVDAGPSNPRRAVSAMGDFGRASGDLAQTWLTPQQLESCAFFWGGGSAMLARDLRRGRFTLEDLRASPWFVLLTTQTFPWTCATTATAAPSNRQKTGRPE